MTDTRQALAALFDAWASEPENAALFTGEMSSVAAPFYARLWSAGYRAALSAQPVAGAVFREPTVLPDGSAFSIVSFPLPTDHWLYAPRGEWDNERDDYAETPRPILTNAQRDAVIAAARYAIRGATMCGQETDFDPDAMALNFAYAMCGPARGKVLPADAPKPQQCPCCGVTFDAGGCMSALQAAPAPEPSAQGEPLACDRDAPVCPWCDRQGWDICQHADDARTCGK